jgi:uncharacterized protein YkwD
MGYCRVACALLLSSIPMACETASKLEQRIFDAVNRERASRGLEALAWHDALAAEARRHALNMAGRRFFSHTDPVRGSLPRRLRESGIRYRRSAENIFNEQGHPDSVAAAVEGWMSSEGHRRNILDPELTHTGVGTAVRGDGTRFFTQIFIRP